MARLHPKQALWVSLAVNAITIVTGLSGVPLLIKFSDGLAWLPGILDQGVHENVGAHPRIFPSGRISFSHCFSCPVWNVVLVSGNRMELGTRSNKA
jgi:hypothetical protein